MTDSLSRVATASSTGPTVLGVSWRDGPSDRVDLAGWIATGGETLMLLKDAAMFASARLSDYGTSVAWGDEDGDLAIETHHLRLIADKRRRFSHKEAARW